MSDLLGIGSSALLAYRSALDVVGHNVANANTVGYARQRADLQARPVYGTQPATGAGVQVSEVARISDRFVFDRLVGEDASYSRIATFDSLTAQLDGWLSKTDTGFAKPLQTFFDGLNTLAANPASSASRQVALQGAGALASSFNDMQARLNSLDIELDSRLGDSVTQINTLAAQIAGLNQRIAEASAVNVQQPPNDLIDQRDSTLRQLAEQVGVSTATADDGSMNVYIGNGQALVLGNRANTLGVEKDPFGRTRELVLRSGGTPIPLTQQISGGAIGGVQDFRREVLEPAINAVGRMATVLADAVNAQHAEGMDQYGALGGHLFTTPVASTVSASTNRGSGRIAATVSDPNALTGGDYVLSFDGSGWRMTDAASGAVTALAGDGSAANPLSGAGLQLTLNGSAQSGDRFLIQPTRFAAGQVKLAFNDAGRLAAASPVRTSVGATNSGVSQIGAPEVLDASNPNLLGTAVIRFTAADRYSINGGAEQAFTSGGNIDFNGWRVQISGQPAAGNTYTISRNDGTSGDNGNAKALTKLSDVRLLDGGRNTLASANGTLVSKVGGQSAQASVQLEAQGTLRSQTQAQRDSVSGVNLDEEAADLMRYQQAYQAAAQIVSAANTLFDALLNAVRR